MSRKTPHKHPEPQPPHTGQLKRRGHPAPAYSPLERSREIEMTRHIAALEDELWRTILKNPAKVKFAIDRVCQIPAFHSYDEGAGACRALIKKMNGYASHALTDKTRRSYDKCVAALAGHLIKADTDREIVQAAVSEVTMRGTFKKSNGKTGQTAHAKAVEGVHQRLTAARNAFIEANQGLVVLIAGRYTWTRMPISDLIQEGNLGLIKAVNRFDCEKGYQFSTYASWWIQSAIGRAIDNKENIIRIPSSAMRNRTRLRKAVRAIRLQTGRDPTEEEIRDETGMGKLRMERTKKHAVTRIFSLDQVVSDTNNLRYVDVLVDEQSASPFEETLIGTMTREVGLHLMALSPLEQSILARRFGLDGADELTLQEIADQYGLSRERIRQIQNRALDTLRHKMALDAA
ncbi:MAG: RNA polymerase sigma factor RpoD/SigA [Myxococcota bacterium]|nr:RNA polymerase sigma factor RpoD/SigA [Myxococcota bacterium]